MLYVIGSGPSSIAAIAACVALKQEVTVLDVGFTEMSNGERKMVNEVDHHEVPLKTVNGSDYPYWLSEPQSYTVKNKEGILSSNAKGGFSAVWGAGVLPYTEEELAKWPISYNDLKQSYESLSSFMPMAGVKDVLDVKFPLLHKNVSNLKQSSQFNKVFNNCKKNQNDLVNEGFFIGKSRLAVHNTKAECTYCSECIEGCPEKIIYSAARTLDDLLQSPLVSYKSGVLVEKLKSIDNEVHIKAFDIKTKEECVFRASKVFLGAGALSSTKIMMRSLEAYNVEFFIKDSQYFLFPIIGPFVKGVFTEKLTTLSQAFCEIINPKLVSFRVHISLYGYSPFLKQFVYNKFGFFSAVLKPFLNLGLKKLYIGQAYLPSYKSNEISLKMVKKNDIDEITINVKKNRKVRSDIRKILKEFNKKSRQTGLYGLWPMLQIAPVGKGFHYGSSMPMKSAPTTIYETNILGESFGLKNVHVIDATVLPEIESGPITFTVMANANRIVTETISK